MTKILFVCHGNICRSPMAEFIFMHMVDEAGHAADFEIASAAVSTEETGNDMYPPAKRMLVSQNIPFTRRQARQATPVAANAATCTPHTVMNENATMRQPTGGPLKSKRNANEATYARAKATVSAASATNRVAR